MGAPSVEKRVALVGILIVLLDDGKHARGSKLGYDPKRVPQGLCARLDDHGAAQEVQKGRYRVPRTSSRQCRRPLQRSQQCRSPMATLRLSW